MKLSAKIKAKLAGIRMLIMDVDGVLTDGKMVRLSDGRDLKVFDAQDGYGIQLLGRAGIKLAIITARDSKATHNRAKELNIDMVMVETRDKMRSYKKLKKKFRIKDEQIAYIGDDWLDLPGIRAAGVGLAVANARPEVKKEADLVTDCRGGDGALRETAEVILRAQRKLIIP